MRIINNCNNKNDSLLSDLLGIEQPSNELVTT